MRDLNICVCIVIVYSYFFKIRKIREAFESGEANINEAKGLQVLKVIG